MLKNHIKLFLRNISRDKSTFFINLVGLSSSLTCVLLVFLWVKDEVVKDQFHANKEQLYQVFRHVPNGQGSLNTYQSNSSLMLTTLQQEVPEVEQAVAVFRINGNAMLQTEDKKLASTGFFASEDYFKLFSFPLLAGDMNTVLRDVNSVVISKEMAENLFGSEGFPVGKSLIIKNGEDGLEDVFTINGIFEIPKNSSQDFDFVLSYKKFLQNRDINDIHWGSNSSSMYALLKTGVGIESFNSKIEDLIKKKDSENQASVFFGLYADNYLKNRFVNGKKSGGRITYVILLSIVALFILIIACINFMNLSTAKAAKRIKEIGVKKVVGAEKSSLIFQFLTESVLLACFSMIVAYAMVALILPWFSNITGKQLEFPFSISLILIIAGIAVVTGLISGSYPAFYLTKFKAISVLKGKLPTSSGDHVIRKGLVIFQFSISILLLVAVSIIYMQLDFIQSKNLGYNKDNIITIERQDGLVNNMETFLEEARMIPGVVNASYMQGDMTNFSNSSSNHRWPGQSEESKKLTFRHAHVGPDFIETMGIEMKEGRSYINEVPNNNSKIILNETAVELMGLENPIGTVIDMRGPNREIIGVVKDFNIQSLYDEITPMALVCRSEWISTLLVKIKAGEEKKTITALTQLFEKFNPGLPFDFDFLDAQYEQLYLSEQRVASLSKYLAGLAILISCLGLFGLVTFTAQLRKKEVSIRKVLGQTTSQAFIMLSSEFVKLVMAAMVITLPIAYLMANDWLSDFAYRIPLRIWYFLGAGCTALIIAMFTVAGQSLMAAKSSPANALRQE
ncbi:ABC transporter permease [Flagellimonas sp. S174]|uniref:ABC transporter permease n=1 Tax=Flagellimonas sp. S174 TaxID=3410790 RepID=UPI003BF527B9